MERPRPSTVAWGVLAGGVAAYDYFCPTGETLSERMDDWIDSPKTKAVALGAVAVTALHLANYLPQRIDPFHRLTTVKNSRP